MICAMPESLNLSQWLTVAEAAEYMGCSPGWVRTLMANGQMPQSRRIGNRVWLVSVADADRAREDLSTRSRGKRHLAKRPAAKRPDKGVRRKATKAARRRKA
jgi:excisionase family DNA binding protein